MTLHITYGMSSSHSWAGDEKGLETPAVPLPDPGAWDSMTIYLPDAVSFLRFFGSMSILLPSSRVSGFNRRHFKFLSPEIFEGTVRIGGSRSSLRISLCNSFRHVAIFLLFMTHAAARFISFWKNARSRALIARLTGGRNISVEEIVWGDWLIIVSMAFQVSAVLFLYKKPVTPLLAITWSILRASVSR